jgi:hypothetical protein
MGIISDEFMKEFQSSARTILDHAPVVAPHYREITNLITSPLHATSYLNDVCPHLGDGTSLLIIGEIKRIICNTEKSHLLETVVVTTDSEMGLDLRTIQKNGSSYVKNNNSQLPEAVEHMYTSQQEKN